MSGIATAMVATAVIGGVVANKANKDALKSQDASSQLASDITQQAAAEAKADINRIFPQAQETANLGFQGALDVFGQSAPAQIDVFQQGNLGAQQALLAGLPQIQNAILGGNVDLSALQPFQVQQPDLGFFQQQTPVTVQAEQAAAEQARVDAIAVNTPVRFPNTNPLGGQNFNFGGSPDRFNSTNSIQRRRN